MWKHRLFMLLSTNSSIIVLHNNFSFPEATSNCTWPHGFLCSNGDCISYDLRCDTFPDCYGEEDEDNCGMK